MACIYTYKGKTYTYQEIVKQLQSENNYSDKELNQLLNTSDVVEKIESMEDLTNYTGGAYGGDTFWDIIGRTFGVTKHIHFRGKDNPNVSKKLRDLGVEAEFINAEKLKLGYEQLEQIYGRKFEESLANDLKARNYFQIINSDAVYAIGKLNQERVNVSGGTAASIDMAKKFKKPIYVYDVGSFGWFKFNGIEFVPTTTPTLTKNFAGIGTRDIELYDKKVNGEYVPNPNYIGDEASAKAQDAIRDVYEKTAQALTVAADSQYVVLPQGVTVVSQPYGVVTKETNPTSETTGKFLSLIIPQILKQAYKENTASYANWMFNFGLRWTRKKSAKAPIKIKSWGAVEGQEFYVYDTLDQNGNPLPSMQELTPIMEMLENELGIDMSDYDSIIGNIYLPGEAIATHRDTSEAESARNYPVIVYTIGNNSGINIYENEKYPGKLSTAQNKKVPIATKDGTIYTFGLDGKGRFEVAHDTPKNISRDDKYPPITLPDGRVVENYTITLTFRRAQEVGGDTGVPVSPARSNTVEVKNTFQPKEINIYSGDRNGFNGLSNFINGPVTTPAGTFPTVEHAYQFIKASFVGNEKVAKAIREAKTGFEAQQLGNKKSLPMTPEQSARWDMVSTNVLSEIMGLAFVQNPKQLALLKSTGSAKLLHKDPKGKVNLKKWETVFPNILTSIRDGELVEVPTIASIFSAPGQEFNPPWETEEFEESKGPVRVVYNNTPGQAKAVLEGYGFDDKNDGATNARNMLTVIADASDSPIFKTLAKLLLSIDKRFDTLSNVNFVLGNENKYETKTATITLNIKDSELVQNLQYVLLHELVHHFTVGKLIDGSEQSTFIRNRIKRFIQILEADLVNYATGVIGSEEAAKLPAILSQLREASAKNEAPQFTFSSEISRSLVNGLNNEFEFLAHLLNDQVFQKFANSSKDTDGRSLGRSVLDMIKAIFKNFKKAIGIKVIDDSILDEGLDAALQVLQNFQVDAVATDEYKYYGQTIIVAVNSEGTGIDVPDLKRSASESQIAFLNRKAKILDAYNTNPNVDPQSPNKPFRGTRTALPDKPYDPDDRYIIKYLPNGTPVYANELQKRAIDATVEHLMSKAEFEEREYPEGETTEDKIYYNMLRVRDEIGHNSYLISGSGGTGKTASVFAAIKAFSQESGVSIGDVFFAAPTHNAVKELQAAIGDKTIAENNVMTVASLLATEVVYEEGVEKFVPKPLSDILSSYKKTGFLPTLFTADYIVIDEVSMFGPKMMDLLVQRLEEREKITGKGMPKFLLMGDYKQIPPVPESEEERDSSNDRDSYFINFRLYPEKSTLLTQVMRTNNTDILGLLQLYIDNIDLANKRIDAILEYDEQTGQRTSLQRVVPPNPNNLKVRKDSTNIKYHYQEDSFIEMFLNAFNEDPTNVNQAVIVNYNKYTRPETQNLINKIRKGLFGEGVKNEYNVGELLIATGPIKISDTRTIENNERLVVLNVTPIQFIKRYSNEYGDTYMIDTPGFKLHLKDAYGEDFTIEVPNKDYRKEAFKDYNKAKKGYIYKGQVIPYGLATKQIKPSLPVLNYGYVVNTHKVQGSTYNHVFVDEGNILKHSLIEGFKPINQFLYTAFSRTRHKLHIYNVENPIQRNSTFTEEITSPTLGLPSISSIKANITRKAAAILPSLTPTTPPITPPVPELERLKAADFQELQIVNLAKQITKVYNDPNLTEDQKKIKIAENKAKINNLREQISDQLSNWSIQKLIEISDQAFNSMDKILNSPNPDVFDLSSVGETYLFFSNLLGEVVDNYGKNNVDPTLYANLETMQQTAEKHRNRLIDVLQEETQIFIKQKTGVFIPTDELYKSNRTSSLLTLLLGAYQSNVKLVSSVAVALQKAVDRIKLRIDDNAKRDDKNLSKFLKKFQFKDILRTETTTNRYGETRTTTQYKTRYLNTYYNARIKVFKKAASALKKLSVITASDMTKKKKQIEKGLNDIEFSVDIRFLFPDEYNQMRKKTYLPANAADIYLAQLKAIMQEQFGDLGQSYVDNRLDEIVNQAIEKYTRYLEDENSYKLALQAQSYTPDEIEARIQDYQAYNNPMLWLDEYKGLQIPGQALISFKTPTLSSLDANGNPQYVKDGEYDASKNFVRLRNADTYLITKAKRLNNGVNLGFYDEEFLQMEKDKFNAPADAVTKMDFLDWAIEVEREYAKMYPSYLRKGRMYFQMADIEKDLDDLWDEASIMGKIALIMPTFFEKVTLAVSGKLPITNISRKIDSLTSMYKRNVRSMNYDNSLNKAGRGDLRQVNPEKYFKAIRESAIHYSEMTNIETNIRLAQTLYSIPEGVTFIQKEGKFSRFGIGKYTVDQYNKLRQYKVSELISTSDKQLLVETINNLMYGGDLAIDEEKPSLATQSSGKFYQMTVKEKMEIERLQKDVDALLQTKNKLQSFKTLSYQEKVQLLRDMKIIDAKVKPSVTWVAKQGTVIAELLTDVNDRIDTKQTKIDQIKTSRYLGPGSVLTLAKIKKYLSLNFLGWNPTGRIPDFLQNGIFANLVVGTQGVDFTMKDFAKSLMYIMPSYGVSNIANIATTYALITGQWWLAGISYGLSRTYNGTSLFGAITNGLSAIATEEAKETKLKLILRRYKVFEHTRSLSDSQLMATFKEATNFVMPGTLLSKIEEVNRGITVLSKLYNFKIKDLQGNERSIIDGYFVNSKGELDWDTTQFPPLNVDTEADLIGKVTGILNETQGNYSNTTPTVIDTNELLGLGFIFRKFIPSTIDNLFAGIISNEPSYNALSRKQYIGSMTFITRRSLPWLKNILLGIPNEKYTSDAAIKLVGQIGTTAVTYFAMRALHEYVTKSILLAFSEGGDDEETELSEQLKNLVWLENMLNMTYNNQMQFMDPTGWKARTAITNFHPLLKLGEGFSKLYDDADRIRLGMTSKRLEAEGELRTFEEADAMSRKEIRSRRMSFTYRRFNPATFKMEKGVYEEIGAWKNPVELEKYLEKEAKGLESEMPTTQRYYNKSRLGADAYAIIPWLHTINSTLNVQERQFEKD